jgi:hypothetical protein
MQALMLFGCSLACGGIGVFLFHLSLLCTKSFAKLTLLMLPKKWREKHAMKHPEKPQPKAVPEGGAAL